ncbi:hypothetical protein [Streptomyces niveus]
MTATLVGTPDPDRRAFATGRVIAGRITITVIPQQQSAPKLPSDPAARRRFVQRMGW